MSSAGFRRPGRRTSLRSRPGPGQRRGTDLRKARHPVRELWRPGSAGLVLPNRLRRAAEAFPARNARGSGHKLAVRRDEARREGQQTLAEVPRDRRSSPADGARSAAPAPAHRLACAAHEPPVLAVDGGRPQGIRSRSIHDGAWAWALAWASVNIWRASSSGLSTWFGYHCCVTSNE